MKIEVVEFYPFYRMDDLERIAGTLHVYLIDLEMDIRGILFKKHKDRWFFHMPHSKAIDPETNKCEKFPIITFTDNEKNRALMKSIREEGMKYIQENVLPKEGKQIGGQFRKPKKKKDKKSVLLAESGA